MVLVCYISTGSLSIYFFQRQVGYICFTGNDKAYVSHTTINKIRWWSICVEAFFSKRVVVVWNSLPRSVVNFTSLRMFRKK